MNSNVATPPVWSTATQPGAHESGRCELSGLNEHLQCCIRGAGYLCGLRAGSATVRAFVLGRFATTLLVLVLLLAAASMMT